MHAVKHKWQMDRLLKIGLVVLVMFVVQVYMRKFSTSLLMSSISIVTNKRAKF